MPQRVANQSSHDPTSTNPAMARQKALGIDASARAVIEEAAIEAVNYEMLRREIIDLSRNQLLSKRGMKSPE